MIKQNAPDQNDINLSSAVLSVEQKYFLPKGPSFVPTFTDMYWYEARKDFTKVINKYRQHAGRRHQQQQLQTNHQINSEDLPIDEINLAF